MCMKVVLCASCVSEIGTMGALISLKAMVAGTLEIYNPQEFISVITMQLMKRFYHGIMLGFCLFLKYKHINERRCRVA